MNSAHESLLRAWDMLVGRLHGPLAFRFMFQPAMAALLAIRAGLSDSNARRPAFGWAVVSDPRQRRDLAKMAWTDIRYVFIATVGIDIIYELIVHKWIFPGQVLIIGVVLALLPYFLVRGLANRIARRLFPPSAKPATDDAVGRKQSRTE
ncbi:MAG TPA: hypothetical protein VMU81_30055 [Acetobacteraceae bacterium]|nr:hypothetical protein [Acetobacteraceae bacterium]